MQINIGPVAASLILGGLILAVALYLKFSQRSAHAENRRYREIFRQMGEGFLIIRRASPNRFFIAEMNHAAAEVLSFCDQHTELAILANSTGGDSGIFLKHLQEILPRVATEGKAVEYKTGYLCKADKRRMVFSVRLTPVKMHGEVEHIVGFIRDISALQLTDTRSAICTRDFCAMAERSPDTIARHDREGNLIYANPAFKLLTSSPSFDNSHEYSATNYREKISEVLESGLEDELECSGLNRAGRTVTHHIRFVPEWGEAGQVDSVLSIGRDITALKNSQHYLQESQTSLRELAARRATEEALLLKDIAREMHEDIAQTLSALRMNMTLMHRHIEHKQPDMEYQYVEAMQRLDRTIGQIREMVSAIHPGVLQMGISLALEWLADEMLGHTYTHYEVQIKTRDEDIGETETSLIFQIARLALENIAQHAVARHVDIVLEQCEDKFRLQIRDNGKGFNLNRSKKESLGLVAMEELSNRLGGEIVFLSAPGKGTEIEVCFAKTVAIQAAPIGAG